jgi:hypothetical protein
MVKGGAINSNPTNKDIRTFGLAALLLFGALCTVALWQAKPALGVFFAAPGLLGLGFLLLPGPMAPVYHGWLKVAHFAGTALTIVTLTIFYFLVMTPTAWLKRLFGGRPLPVKPDPGASSYWVPRREPAQPKERFYKRY